MRSFLQRHAQDFVPNTSYTTKTVSIQISVSLRSKFIHLRISCPRTENHVRTRYNLYKCICPVLFLHVTSVSRGPVSFLNSFLKGDYPDIKTLQFRYPSTKFLADYVSSFFKKPLCLVTLIQNGSRVRRISTSVNDLSHLNRT